MRTFGTGEKVILSVEDDDTTHHLMVIAFEEVGGDFRLYRVKDGEQALAFIRRSDGYDNAPPFDLLLLNLNLPKVRGCLRSGARQ
jgi:CheY-like chemotaxis protein